MSHNAKTQWQSYVDAEISKLTPILETHGYSLDDVQPHIRGERFLMYAVTAVSGKKVILFGNDTQTGKRVVIKATSDSAGKKELQHERSCRTLLKDIYFAYSAFYAPEELLHTEADGMMITVQEYVAQTSTFLERPTTEQFSLALGAFKMQEGAHATTHKHFKDISSTFGTRTSDEYLAKFSTFTESIQKTAPADTSMHPALMVAGNVLKNNRERIEQYCGFLTHTDFVPHNFRIKDNTLYLLDFSALIFGNKYEGWARFLNFMTIHNPKLEQYLEQYVTDNRSSEEKEALHLMRIYRLGEIIRYYTGTLANSSGDLLQLNTARIDFWHEVLKATLMNTTIPEETRSTYIQLRDSLRGDGEKERQKGLL